MKGRVIIIQKKVTRFLFVFFVALCLVIFLATCNHQEKLQQTQKEFDVFMNDLFIQEVQSDTLSLKYSLSNPESYGIKQVKATLGEYSMNRMNQDLTLYENYLKHLSTFDYDLLTPEQKLTYDIVKNYLMQNMNFGSFMYYTECLGPTTGIQAQLPILLAEFNFSSKDDLDEYIELLNCVSEYFDSIIQYEQEKSDHGLFMNDAVAKRIISQCKAFIDEPENNFLIQYFDEKINNYDFISKKEIAYYKAMNKEAVINHVIPAYEALIEALTELLGSGTNRAGLYYYPEGQAYYECLTKYKTGSKKSMDGIIKMLDTAIGNGVINITALSQTDPAIVDKYLAFTSFPLTNPEEIIRDLKDDIKRDFPEAVPVNCKIKYVPESLSEYLSPAMYLVPPIDNYKNNNIYINGSDSKTLSMIYTTVAHEGYPGHLYQCVYFRDRNPAPIRNLLNFVGYDEGWATYVELYSYHISGIDDNLADFLEWNNMVILCMYARADIGIHYEGWTKKMVVNYITQFISDEKTAVLIYNTLLEEPAIYLPYAVGYLEIMELRNTAEQKLGDQFVAKDFHRFLLDIGPAQFGIIEDNMNSWVEKRK